MKKRILLVTAELADVAPIGGVAEYILGLASSLQLAGHDVKIALPRYGFLQALNPETILPDLTVWPGYVHEHHTVVQGLSIPNLTDPERKIPILLIGQHTHFDGAMRLKDVHQAAGQGPEPWEEFSRAVVDYVVASHKKWAPDIIHCHDGHTALVPVYISQLKQQMLWPSKRCRTVLTVHNLLYQGKGGNDRYWHAGIDDILYGGVYGHYGDTNAFKAGLYLADAVSTVSYTYRNEICERSDVGFGLEGVLDDLRHRGRLRGIVNGINESRWCVGGLPYYCASDADEMKKQRETLLTARRHAKLAVIRSLGWSDSDLDVPFVSIRGRWDEQKGFYPFIDALDGPDRILSNARVLLVTWGEPNLDDAVPPDHPNPDSAHRSRRYWKGVQDLSWINPGRLRVNPPALAGPANLELHYLASDFLVVPSRYEPCGLIQMECQRYGTIPIVRRTGGLADTVSECETIAYPSPNGFTFENFHWGDIAYAVKRATDRYVSFRSGSDGYLGWMIDNTLLQQNSWDARIPQYEALYGF
ncbi:MAG: glycogen synthase [Capsulimonadaceae bacterium]